MTRLSPSNRFQSDVLDGLSRPQKELPCKYFYDERGAQLFERICRLPEYYLTRAELEIMRRHAGAMARFLGEDCLVIEYGSGSSLKTPLLLERLCSPAGYVPVDISSEQLLKSAAAVQRRFPGLNVDPLWADFTEPFELPDWCSGAGRRVVYFPGSTIGNFGPPDALGLLDGIAQLCGPGGGLLVGVDLAKPAAVVEPAYNDSAGVTAAFNKNMLARVNVELGGDFDLDGFSHHAFFDERHSRIEMHLVSRRAQTVHVAGTTVQFHEGQSIRTEHSYKYSREAFRNLARVAGLTVQDVWTDAADLFSVQWLAASSSVQESPSRCASEDTNFVAR